MEKERREARRFLMQPFVRDTGRKTTATVDCPKSMVGRVIGKNGDTIKALQNYTGSLIQVNQQDDPCQITISGTQQSLSLALSMVADIVRGTFKGFALLRSLAGPPIPHQQLQQLPRPIYAPGYGLIPSTQFFGADGTPRDSPDGPLSPGGIDPAALMGWGGMGGPAEQWQGNGIARSISAQQQLASLAGHPYGISPSLLGAAPPNPYVNPQGMGVQQPYRGGPTSSQMDPYALAALYAQQGMNQDVFLGPGSYQDLGPLFAAAASANVGVVNHEDHVTGLGIRGNMGMPMHMGSNMGRLMQAAGMGNQHNMPMAGMMDQAGVSAAPVWLNNYSQQHLVNPIPSKGHVNPSVDDERPPSNPAPNSMSHAQQQQIQAVSSMMANAKLNDEDAGGGEDPNGNSLMQRDANGNYYFNSDILQGRGNNVE